MNADALADFDNAKSGVYGHINLTLYDQIDSDKAARRKPPSAKANARNCRALIAKGFWH